MNNIYQASLKDIGDKSKSAHHSRHRHIRNQCQPCSGVSNDLEQSEWGSSGGWNKRTLMVETTSSSGGAVAVAIGMALDVVADHGESLPSTSGNVRSIKRPKTPKMKKKSSSTRSSSKSSPVISRTRRSSDANSGDSSKKAGSFKKASTRRSSTPAIISPSEVTTADAGLLESSWYGYQEEPPYVKPDTSKNKSRRRSKSTTAMKGRPSGSTHGRRRSSSEASKRRNRSFAEDLLSSKDLSAALAPAQQTAPAGVPMVAATKVETSKVSLDDPLKGQPGSTHGRRRSSSEVSKRRNSSFVEDLLSSKDLSAVLAPAQHTAPPTGGVPLIAATKVETSKVSLYDPFSPSTTSSGEKHSTKSCSRSTEKRGGRRRSSSGGGRRKQPSDIEEKPNEEVRSSKKDSPTKPRTRSISSRGGRRRDSASDLGADPSSGENSTGQGRRSSTSTRGRRSVSSKDSGKRHATEENTQQNPAMDRSNSKGASRRASLVASMEDSVRLADPTQTSSKFLRSTSVGGSLRKTASSNKNNSPSHSRSLSGDGPSQSSRRRGSSLDVTRRNAANRPLSSSKILPEQSLSDETKHVLLLSSVSLHSQLEAKSWDCLQKRFSSLDASESARGGGSPRSGRASRRMPKVMTDQDKYMDSSLYEVTKNLSEETKANCGVLSIELRERFRSDFAGAKDMPTDDELKERYRNVHFAASHQTAPSPTASTDETDTSEPKKDSEDEEDKEELDTTTEKHKETYSDKLVAATRGKPASLTMRSKARRKSQAVSENTLDPLDPSMAEPEGAGAMPNLGVTSRRDQVLKTFEKSVFSLKNTTSDDGPPVKSSGCSKSKKKEEKKEDRKMMKKGKKDDAQPGGDVSLFPSTVATPKGAKSIRGPAGGALFKMTSILKFDEDVWAEPSADSKVMKDKHDDSSRTCSDSRPRSGREKEGETPPSNKKVTEKQQDMFGFRTTTEIRTEAPKKSKGAVMRSSISSCKDGVINSNDDVSRSQTTKSRKVKFVSRNSIANDMPDNDTGNSCENADNTMTSARSRRTSTKTSGSTR
jgi:hypothetical protein